MKSVTPEQFTLCPRFQKTFSILGKKWNGLIIDVLIEEGSQRFVEMANKIPEVSDRVLVERLKELEEEGIVERTVSCTQHNRIEYELTDKGYDLRNVMREIQSWSEKWISVETIS